MIEDTVFYLPLIGLIIGLIGFIIEALFMWKIKDKANFPTKDFYLVLFVVFVANFIVGLLFFMFFMALHLNISPGLALLQALDKDGWATGFLCTFGFAGLTCFGALVLIPRSWKMADYYRKQSSIAKNKAGFS